MKETADHVQLRPLGFGEIFDRAVTLYVQNFAGFSIIVLFVLVPFSIANYMFLSASTAANAVILQQVLHPQPGASAPFPISPALVWLFIIGALFTPFANVATAIGVARLYASQAVDWRRCYGAALARWPQILLALLTQLAIFAGAVFVGSIVIGVLTTFSVLSFTRNTTFGVAGFIITAALFLAWLALLLMLYLTSMFAFDAVGIESLAIGAAVGAAFRRIFNRTEFVKALLFGLAVLAIQIGIVVVSAILVAVLEAGLKSHLVDTLAQGIVSLISTAFLAILIAVYYYDVRVRREGLDLQASVEAMTPAAQLPA
ncbi:MAG: hypothetical protein M3R35_00390 [Candidatus Eremiobacteraeota bacterium]|nr:hypothetical protein [Candidatus Eremiobacteraeota bacterium]